ncbi:MAG TPA: glycosyl hydrolase family 28 protein [Anaerolineaceae bacterium]
MFNVRSFGAVGDGQTLDRDAIQSALNACARAGGGEVYLPAGTYLSGTLEIPSHTVLNISPGATLLGSPRIEDYTRDPRGRDGDQTGYHLLRVADAGNVVICGGGTVDGQGPTYWDSPAKPVDGKSPWRGYHLAYSPHDARPSPMLTVYKCQDVRIENLTLTNSAGWAVNTVLSRWLWVRGVKILNPMNGPNTDGIDIQSCQDMFISDCHIENGDDSIVAFTSPGSGPCERLAITNCILSTRCCAIKFYNWGEPYAFRQITCNNIVVYNTERAFGAYMRDQSVLQDVVCSNFTVHGGCTPPNFSERQIHIDVANPPEGADDEENSYLASLQGITFANWIIRSSGRIIVGGNRRVPVRNLAFHNILLEVNGSQDMASFVNPTPSTGQWNRTLPHIRTIPAHLVIHAVRGLTVDGVRVANASSQPLQPMHGMYLENVEDDRINGFSTYPLQPGCEQIVRK